MEQLKGDISTAPKIMVLMFWKIMIFALRKAVETLSMFWNNIRISGDILNIYITLPF